MSTDIRKKKASLDRERWLNRWKFRLSLGLAGMAAVTLAILFGGESTQPVRDAIGLSDFMAGERGVYADCSKVANRNNRFCRAGYEGPSKVAHGISSRSERSGTGSNLLSLSSD